MPDPSGLDCITLDEWLGSTAKRREELDNLGKRRMPADVSERHAEEDDLLQALSDSERLKADAEWYLTQETARAALKYSDSDRNADEKKALVKAEVAGISRLVEGLKTTAKVLDHRYYLTMSQGRRL